MCASPTMPPTPNNPAEAVQWEQYAGSTAFPVPTRPATLFELSDEILRLESLFDPESPLTDEERERVITAYLDTAGKLESKLDNYAALIKEFEARAKARNEEAARMQARARTDQAAADALKARLAAHFEAHAIDKVNTKRYTIRLQSNGGKYPMEVMDGLTPDDVPEQFRKVTVSINNEAIRGELEAGAVLDFAKLLPRGKHIRIA